MVLNIEPWEMLTRFGVPEFVVAGQPLMLAGQTLVAGEPYPVEGNERTIRQLYDLNLIAVAAAVEASIKNQKKKKRTHQCP